MYSLPNHTPEGTLRCVDDLPASPGRTAEAAVPTWTVLLPEVLPVRTTL